VPNPWALSQKFVENQCRNFEQADLGRFPCMLLQFSRYGLPPSGELESRRQFWIERVRRDAARISQPLAGSL
jgi:hypothetical protein